MLEPKKPGKNRATHRYGGNCCLLAVLLLLLSLAWAIGKSCRPGRRTRCALFYFDEAVQCRLSYMLRSRLSAPGGIVKDELPRHAYLARESLTRPRSLPKTVQSQDRYLQQCACPALNNSSYEPHLIMVALSPLAPTLRPFNHMASSSEALAGF